MQTAPGTLAIPATATNFDGVGNGFTGPAGPFTVTSAPPDTNGAVGPNHYRAGRQHRLRRLQQDAARRSTARSPTNTLWSGFGGGCQTNNDGDATVVVRPVGEPLDHHASSPVTTTPYLQCVAVSTTRRPDRLVLPLLVPVRRTSPTTRSSASGPTPTTITFNMFNASGTAFLGAEVCAYDRAKMLTGAAATQQCFTLSATLRRPAARPTSTARRRRRPARRTTSSSFATTALDALEVPRRLDDAGELDLTGPTSSRSRLHARPAAAATCIPQSGTTQQLDSLADRLMYRLAYRNFGDHESLVVNHSVDAQAARSACAGTRLRDPNGDADRLPAGHLRARRDATAGWAASRWTSAGNIGARLQRRRAAACTPASATPAASPATRSDTMPQGEGTHHRRAPARRPAALSRWGDYSAMTVDPSRRLHLLVHQRVHPGERRLQLADAHRLVQVRRLRRPATERLLDLARARPA